MRRWKFLFSFSFFFFFVPGHKYLLQIAHFFPLPSKPILEENNFRIPSISREWQIHTVQVVASLIILLHLDVNNTRYRVKSSIMPFMQSRAAISAISFFLSSFLPFFLLVYFPLLFQARTRPARKDSRHPRENATERWFNLRRVSFLINRSLGTDAPPARFLSKKKERLRYDAATKPLKP